MSMVYIIIGIICLFVAVVNFIAAGRVMPENSYWKNLPSGKYTTSADYRNDRYVIKDVYGKEVVIFKREDTPNDKSQ